MKKRAETSDYTRWFLGYYGQNDSLQTETLTNSEKDKLQGLISRHKRFFEKVENGTIDEYRLLHDNPWFEHPINNQEKAIMNTAINSTASQQKRPNKHSHKSKVTFLDYLSFAGEMLHAIAGLSCSLWLTIILGIIAYCVMQAVF